MSDLTWASDMLREHVAPPGTAQYVETRIRGAAKAIGWKFSRAREVWYKDERVALRPRELRQIEEYTGLRYGRTELTEVDALISRADTFLVGADPNYVSAFAAGLRAFIGALDRSRVEGGDN